MISQIIFTETDLQSAATLSKRPVGTLFGQGIKIINQSQYQVNVYQENQIDAIPPFSYLIMPMRAGLWLSVDTSVSASYTQPYEFVSVVTIDTQVIYTLGSLWQSSAQNTIVNTTSNPAVQQAATGAYSTQESFNEPTSSTASGTWTLLSSSAGGYVNALQINYNESSASSGDTVTIYNGTDVIDHSTNYTGSHTYNFANGVVNNGITLSYSSNQGLTGMSAVGYVVVSQNTPPGVPKVIQ